MGALEEIILDPEFEETQRTFGMENCEHFEETDENKLVYTELFSKYTAMLEKIMLERLAAAVEGFDMVEFSNMLEARKDELDGDVFDMLMTLNDFDSFKELMLSYKAEMENGPASPSMGITVAPMHIYGEEQEDGEERPDLDLCLGVTGMGK